MPPERIFFKDEEGNCTGYAEVIQKARGRVVNRMIFQGRFKVFDARGSEIAVLDFSRDGTKLTFAGETQPHYISPMSNPGESMAFLIDRSRNGMLAREFSAIDPIISHFADIIITHSDNRGEMQRQLSDYAQEIVEPTDIFEDAKEHAETVSIRLPRQQRSRE